MPKLKKISIIALASVFMLSATGIFLNFHECQTCHIKEVLINNHNHNHSLTSVEQNGCCSGMNCKSDLISNSDCCKDQIFYLKIIEPYTFSILKINNYVAFGQQVLNLFKTEINPFLFLFYKVLNKPPEILSGSKLLLNIQVFRL
jgi:hypothetical protein